MIFYIFLLCGSFVVERVKNKLIMKLCNNSIKLLKYNDKWHKLNDEYLDLFADFIFV